MSGVAEFDATIGSTPLEASTIHKKIVRLFEKHHISTHDISSMRLALEEALTNAIKHGNQMDPHKSVRISCRIDADRIRIVIEDEGVGFRMNNVPDPTLEKNLDKSSGRGIILMRSLMSVVEYNETGNQLVLEKNREQSVS